MFLHLIPEALRGVCVLRGLAFQPSCANLCCKMGRVSNILVCCKGFVFWRAQPSGETTSVRNKVCGTHVSWEVNETCLDKILRDFGVSDIYMSEDCVLFCRGLSIYSFEPLFDNLWRMRAGACVLGYILQI